MSRKITSIGLSLLLLASAMAKPIAAAGVTGRTIELADQVEVHAQVYPGDRDMLVLWIAPDYGFKTAHQIIARQLSERGMELWLVDMTEALFITRGSAGMKAIDGKYIAELTHKIHDQTKKKIVLISEFYGAIPVLRGARQWQLENPDSEYLLGAILFSPYLFLSIPSLGQEPRYVSIARHSAQNIIILQGEFTGNKWQAQSLLAMLHEGGSQVFFEIMPAVTSLFYDEQRTPAEQRLFVKLPEKIERLTRLLARLPPIAAPAVVMDQEQAAHAALDIGLRPYRGDPIPLPIALNDINGKLRQVNNYEGKVTLINFWATWCPPCVHEIPSLNRLKVAMKDRPFELISIDYAEAPEQIREFMKHVHVNFPVLIDSTGKIAEQWKVIAFPSTFVIGPDGQIKYGVNAAIEWDDPQVIRQIMNLYQTK